MTVEYIRKIEFKCMMCSKYSSQQYSYSPHKAIIDLLPEESKKPIDICKKCAERESSKSEWSEIKRKKHV